MKLSFVKKIKTDGSPCKKCADVEQRLRDNQQWELLDEIIVADERDDASPGMLLARDHQVEQAPFFLVEDENGEVSVYTIYFQFAREILEPLLNSRNEII